MKFIVYSKNGCPNCVHAKNWLTLHNLEFTEASLDDDKVRQDFYDTCGDGVRTVPQIFVQYDGTTEFIRIGGFTDLIGSDILAKKDIEIDGDF